MFTQTWKKYLSIIIILIKRSSNGPQEMQLNFSDFERAAGGRKIKFNFVNMQLHNGRQQYGEKLPPVATDLMQVLQENDIAAALLKTQHLTFAMTTGMTLTITNTSAAVAEETAQAAEATETAAEEAQA